MRMHSHCSDGKTLRALFLALVVSSICNANLPLASAQDQDTITVGPSVEVPTHSPPASPPPLAMKTPASPPPSSPPPQLPVNAGEKPNNPLPVPGNPQRRVPQQFLYVLCGDMDKRHNDFVTTLNFNRESRNYGRVVSRSSLACAGNEPYMLNVGVGNKIMAAGGFLSFLTGTLSGQPDTFWFNLSNPGQPRLIKRNSGLSSVLTSFFYPLRNGNWLSTRMGSNLGGAPGKVAEFNSQLNRIAEYGTFADFNPHGIDVREDLDLFITTDFLLPISALLPPIGDFNDMTFQNSIRIWKLSTRTLVSSKRLPDGRPANGSGIYTIRFIPGDPQGRALATGVFDGAIYLVTVNRTTYRVSRARVALNLTAVYGIVATVKGGGPTALELEPRFKIGFVTLTASGKVLQFSYANPAALRILRTVDLGALSNPGEVKIFPNDNRIAVSTYFLDFSNPGRTPIFSTLERPFGKVRLGGSKKVYVMQFNATSLWRDPKWPNINFNTLFNDTGPAAPHGLAFFPRSRQ